MARIAQKISQMANLNLIIDEQIYPVEDRHVANTFRKTVWM
ncbi:hypothetical protein [Spirosoma profusum]|nr:hypothetical protein [Spirosoma profusum]